METIPASITALSQKKRVDPGEKTGLSRMMDKKIDEQFDIFLKLLITQMRNQDPTAPMDSNDMTQNMMMFYSAAEQAKTNHLLQQLNETEQASASSNFLHKEVEYAANIFNFDGDSQRVLYDLPKDIKEATLYILDTKSVPVHSIKLQNLQPGKAHVEWDGKNIEGQMLPYGHYQVAMAAKYNTPQQDPTKDRHDPKNKPTVDTLVPTRLVGVITSYEKDAKGKPTYYIGDIPIDNKEIIRVRKKVNMHPFANPNPPQPAQSDQA